MRKTNGKKKKENEDESRDANAVDEYVGLDRQYNDGMLLADSHANGSIFKSVRDCQQVKLHLLKSEYKYLPDWLKRRKRKLEDKILKSGLRTTIELRKQYRELEADMRSIGFTHLHYIKETGVDKLRNVSKEEILVLPNQTPYAYNDRVLQKNYRHAPKIQKQEQVANS